MQWKEQHKGKSSVMASSEFRHKQPLIVIM